MFGQIITHTHTLVYTYRGQTIKESTWQARQEGKDLTGETDKLFRKFRIYQRGNGIG
jgi:hypothetical protein